MKKLAAIAILPALALAVPAVAEAATVINNGLAPPNPANVIDADNSFPLDVVLVQNVGCDGTVLPSCPMPWGDPTSVELMDGGIVFLLEASESSVITMSGGRVAGGLGAHDASTVTIGGGSVSTFLGARDSSTVTLSGGDLESDFVAFNSSMVTMSGGSVGRDLIAYDSSTVAMIGGSVAGKVVALGSSIITIVGSDFAVDGAPVSPGPIAARSGTLTGTLESGEPMNNLFCHSGCTDSPAIATGLITLVPESDLALRFPVAAFGLAALRAARRRAKCCRS